jgi:DNA-directed RNA polymerase specialized sigma24 family protein
MAGQLLINKIKEGDRDALYEVYKSYKEPFLMYCLKNHSFPNTKEGFHDIETIYHDMIIAFRRNCINGKLDELGKASLKTYLFSIGNNLIKNYFNKISNQNKLIEPKSSIVSEELQDGYDDITLRVVNILKAGRLGETCTKLLTYFFFDELPIAEIQVRLDFPTENAVSQRKIRCLASLREMIS